MGIAITISAKLISRLIKKRMIAYILFISVLLIVRILIGANKSHDPNQGTDELYTKKSRKYPRSVIERIESAEVVMTCTVFTEGLH